MVGAAVFVVILEGVVGRVGEAHTYKDCGSSQIMVLVIDPLRGDRAPSEMYLPFPEDSNWWNLIFILYPIWVMNRPYGDILKAPLHFSINSLELTVETPCIV